VADDPRWLVWSIPHTLEARNFPARVRITTETPLAAFRIVLRPDGMKKFLRAFLPAGSAVVSYRRAFLDPIESRGID
jgi:hypothetical protein